MFSSQQNLFFTQIENKLYIMVAVFLHYFIKYWW